MRAVEFITENKITLNKLYGGNFPDRDESFWDEVRPHEFDNELEVKVMPKHKLAIMIQSQYRVEHLDELLDMMDEDQQEILQRYMNDPSLSNKIILLSGDRIIDGNHRALAAAMKGVPINYVDLVDLDEQDVIESGDNPYPIKWVPLKFGEFKAVATLDDASPLEIYFNKRYEAGIPAWTVDFDRNKSQEVTGEGDAVRVFSTVLDTVVKFIQKKNPQSLSFTAEKKDDPTGSRTKLYDRLIQRYADKLGYSVERQKQAKRTFYKLTTKDKQGVTEGFDKEAGAWRDWQIKMLPRKIEMLSRLVKGWVPSEEDHIAAIEAGYLAMKETGDVKDAAKAIADTLKEIQRQQGVAEGKQQVERNGIQLNVSIDGATVDIRPMINGNQVGYVVFDRDGETLVADDLAIDEEYRGRGIAKIIYDYLKELGFTIKRSTDQLPAGKAFWDKYKGVQGQVWEDEHVDEMALSTYKTMGDFTKPGPFTGADKKLVPHPKNIEKATQFFEQTPFDFRLFFSHLKGTGKYSEHGPMSPDQIRQVFGQDAEEIINGSEDAITVVYVGNKGDSKVMLTPWMMAHRFGHAVNAGARNKNWTAWGEAEKYFFQTVNNLLEEHYGKVPATKPAGRNILYQLEPEYNALFNAMGTQRSSKTGQIRRPYEFLYELFAQYLGTGKVTLNPLPTNLGYGRKVFGNPTKYMNIKPEYRDEGERKQAADSLAYTMELLFNDVLSDSVGKIFVM